jgi:hypothetical protein
MAHSNQQIVFVISSSEAFEFTLCSFLFYTLQLHNNFGCFLVVYP